MVVLLVLCCVQEVCFGRVGDSKEQLGKRYGEPINQITDKEKIAGASEMGFDEQLHFFHNSAIVKVNMRSGKSVAEQIIFLRGKAVVPIAEGMRTQVEAMLKETSGGQEWRRMPAAVAGDEFLFFWSPAEEGSVAYVRRNLPTVLVVEESQN